MSADLLFVDTHPVLRSGAATDARALQLAGGLATLGIEDGDVIAVMLRNWCRSCSCGCCGYRGRCARATTCRRCASLRAPARRARPRSNARCSTGGVLSSMKRLANYKLPRKLEFVAELPRDDNGKVAKRKLRDAWWAKRERRI